MDVAREIPASLISRLDAAKALIPEVMPELANPEFATAPRRVLIVRLSPWKDLDRSSSHLLIFSETRRALPEAFIDFAFFPGKADRDILSDAGLPWFYGIASRGSPAAFDLVLVSNAFGLELVNLAGLFTTAGLPLLASQRASAFAAGSDGGTAVLPIVILGGSNAAACGPLVLENGDSIVEGLFFGEGEGAIGELVRLLSDRGRTREQRLDAAESVEGFWSIRSPAGKRTKVRRLDSSPPPLVDPVVLNSPESATARLQISAGCPGLCSFCFEGWDRRPYRELPEAEVVRAARLLKRRTGADTLEVYTFNFNTHEAMVPLMFELGRVYRRVNLMSQRLDILASSPALLAAELAADKRSFTLGIEGLSGRMRSYYRKGLSDRDIERLEELLLVPGVRELKLFYIIAGLEEAADLAEFADFMRRLGERRDERAKGLRILVSAGYLVRIPRTPLEYAPLALEEAPLAAIAAAMERACAMADAEFRLAVHFDEYCADQLLVLGDGRVGKWLLEAPANGFVYDGPLSRGAWESLRAHAERTGLLGPAFLSEKGENWSPPLPFLEHDAEVLRNEYLFAQAGKDREACLGGSCSGCGACPDPAAIAAMTGHAFRGIDAAAAEKIGRLTAAKAAFKPVHLEVELPLSLAGAADAYRGAWLTRRLVSAGGEGAELAVFESRECLFSGSVAYGLPEGFIGRTVFAVYGPRTERIAELALAAGFRPVERPAMPERLRIEISLPDFLGYGDGKEAIADMAAALKTWLSRSHVNCTEFATPGGRRFEVAPKDARKAVLFAAEIRTGRAGNDMEAPSLLITAGKKADLSTLLAALGESGRGARVAVRA